MRFLAGEISLTGYRGEIKVPEVVGVEHQRYRASKYGMLFFREKIRNSTLCLLGSLAQQHGATLLLYCAA